MAAWARRSARSLERLLRSCWQAVILQSWKRQKRSWTSLVWRAIFAKLTLQIAHRCRHWQTMLHRWGSVKLIIHTSGVSPSDTGTENIIKINAEDGVMINFASVAAYTMPQTDEWTDAFEAWNEPNFYDRLLSHAHASEAHRQSTGNCRKSAGADSGRTLGPPCEMGALTAFLCSSGAVYVNGVDILADGGQNARDLCSAYLVNFFAKCFQNSEIKMDMKWAALRSGKPPF